MPREHVDWLGNYTPRVQPHFRLWPSARGGQRLSLGSMHMFRVGADYCDLLAMQMLRGEISNAARRALLQ